MSWSVSFLMTPVLVKPSKFQLQNDKSSQCTMTQLSTHYRNTLAFLLAGELSASAFISLADFARAI